MPTIAELLKPGDLDKITSIDLVVGVDPGSPEGDRTVVFHPRGMGKVTEALKHQIKLILGSNGIPFDKMSIGRGYFQLPPVKVGDYTLMESRAPKHTKTASIQVKKANGGWWDLIKSFRYTRGDVNSKLEALGRARNHANMLTESGDIYAHLAPPDRNWQIDYVEIGGSAMNKCSKCRGAFIGKESRTVCRMCSNG